MNHLEPKEEFSIRLRRHLYYLPIRLDKLICDNGIYSETILIRLPGISFEDDIT